MESLNNGIVFKRNILLLKKNVPMYVCYKPIKLLLSFLFLCLCVNANLSVRIVRYPEHSHSQKLTTLTKFTLNHHQSPPPLLYHGHPVEGEVKRTRHLCITHCHRLGQGQGKVLELCCHSSIFWHFPLPPPQGFLN